VILAAFCLQLVTVVIRRLHSLRNGCRANRKLFGPKVGLEGSLTRLVLGNALILSGLANFQVEGRRVPLPASWQAFGCEPSAWFERD